MSVTIRPHHDLVELRPRPDLHSALHGIQIEGGNIMTKMFGNVRVGSPISYQVTGKVNQFAFGEVLGIGSGNVTGQGRDIPHVKRGDIVGFDLGQIGHVLPGSGNYVTSWRNLLCRFDPGKSHPTPLMNYVMVEYDSKLVDRFVFQRSTLFAPVKNALVKTNDRERTKVGLTVARVVGFGQGRYVKGVFEPTETNVGDVVAYMPHNGVVDFTFKHGQLLRFVPWKECDFTVEGLDD